MTGLRDILSRLKRRKPVMTYDEDLIFDIGANNGQDSEFYLLKGFRVVAVEANPTLYDRLKERFSNDIRIGRLVLLNIGVWSEEAIRKFYINLDNDHWSSFDPDYGCRENTRFETVDMHCFTISEILRRFGLPYYMKIDVEGADKHILSDLRKMRHRSPFISVEEYGVATIDCLHDLKYKRFKFTPQRDKSGVAPPNPPAEGLFVPRIFSGIDSGLFGRELPGEWLPYKDARAFFLANIRNEKSEWMASPHEWYDVHATWWDRLPPAVTSPL